MGAKVSIFEVDGNSQIIYLSTDAVNFYQRNNVPLTILEDNISDDIIQIFHMSNAVTVKEGATFQELLNYYLFIGLDRDSAVKKAQSQIGISKEKLIKILDVFQIEIISDKQAKLIAAEEAIKEQTDTQKTTFEELDLSGFGDSAPKINTETLTIETLRNLPETTGDISKESLDFVTSKPEPSTETTKETPKQETDKSGKETTMIPTKKDSEPFDFKSFGTSTSAIIALGIITASIIGVIIISRRKS